MSINTMNTIDNLNKDRRVPKTSTTKYILPMIFGNNYRSEEIIKNGFINAYLYKDDRLILVYKLSEDNIGMDKNLKENDNYVGDLDLNKNSVGYIFQIPEEYKEDVDKLKEGLNTKISDNHKENILRFWNLDEVKEDFYFRGILYGTDKGKEFYENHVDDKTKVPEGEYFEKPDIEYEKFENIDVTKI